MTQYHSAEAVDLSCLERLIFDFQSFAGEEPWSRFFIHFFSDGFLGFSVRPFAGFPGYSYFPNPTAAASGTTPGTPTASGPERGSTYYDYVPVAATATHQPHPQVTARPEQTVNGSPLHRHHSDPHASIYRTTHNVTQRKQSNATSAPPRTNHHQQMMLRSELYTPGGEDHGVKAYVTGTSPDCRTFLILCMSSCARLPLDCKLHVSTENSLNDFESLTNPIRFVKIC